MWLHYRNASQSVLVTSHEEVRDLAIGSHPHIPNFLRYIYFLRHMCLCRVTFLGHGVLWPKGRIVASTLGITYSCFVLRSQISYTSVSCVKKSLIYFGLACKGHCQRKMMDDERECPIYFKATEQMLEAVHCHTEPFFLKHLRKEWRSLSRASNFCFLWAVGYHRSLLCG